MKKRFKTWKEIISFPCGERKQKPREQGLTMIIDKGLGLLETEDLLQVCGSYIDFVKLGFGTSALYEPEILEEKIYLIRSFGIEVYPGGTFLEIAILQDKLVQYLRMVKDFGFTAVEISDGTIRMNDKMREKAIALAAGLNLIVLTEAGKKDSAEQPGPGRIAGQVKRDFENGAHYVIIEGRELGINVGFYDQEGHLKHDEFEELLFYLGEQKSLIWEAPLKGQQQEMIMRFGPDVNLGNIPPHEVIALEALRVGLRSDTLRVYADIRPGGVD